MKKSIIQFHATPEELFEFLNCLRNEVKFSVAIIGWKPFSLKLVSKYEEFDFNKLGTIGKSDFIRVVISSSESLTPADSEGRFYNQNAGSVTIDIGVYSDNSLGESALSFMSSNIDEIEFANKIISRLKKITSAGVMAVNPDTGAESIIKTHRYTQAAKMLYDSGIRIMPIAGKAYLKL